MSEHETDAILAGYEYKFETKRRGVMFSVSGFNDKLNRLLERVLIAMRSLVIEH